MEVRVAAALRILAGGSYWDVALMFGLSRAVTFEILWQVIDAINETPAIGAFDFPLTEEGCMRNANRFKVRPNGGQYCNYGYSWRHSFDQPRDIVYFFTSAVSSRFSVGRTIYTQPSLIREKQKCCRRRVRVRVLIVVSIVRTEKYPPGPGWFASFRCPLQINVVVILCVCWPRWFGPATAVARQQILAIQECGINAVTSVALKCPDTFVPLYVTHDYD